MPDNSIASISVSGPHDYEKGERVAGTVSRVLKYGFEVDLSDHKLGVIRNRELRWDDEPESVVPYLRPGMAVEALVIGTDRDRSRMELSLRQLRRDPWVYVGNRLHRGQIVAAHVVRLWKSGVFVEMEEGLEGFIPLSEVSAIPPRDIQDILWVGDAVEAVITRIDERKRQIELSLRVRSLQLDEEVDAHVEEPKARTGDMGSLASFLRPRDRLKLVEWARLHRQDDLVDDELGHGNLATRLPRILLADDDAAFRSSLSRLLRRLGHHVETTESPEKALHLSQNNRYDLVLIDMDFREERTNGLDTARRIRDVAADAAIVLVTGIDQLQLRRINVKLAKDHGIAGILIKPATLCQLQQVMRYIADKGEAWDAFQLKEDLHQTELQVLRKKGDRISKPTQANPAIMEAIDRLLHKVRATACIFFTAQKETGEIEVGAHIGAPIDAEELAKHDLYASPVADVINEKRNWMDGQAERNPLQYKHLRLLPFASLIGVPVEVAGTVTGALFLFHTDIERFGPSDIECATTTGMLIAALQLKSEAERIAIRMQPWIFAGQLGSTLVHDLNNSLGTILHDMDTLRADYALLRQDPGQALEPDWRGRMEASISSIKTKSPEITDIIGTYLGLLTNEKYEPTNVNDVIRKSLEFLKLHARKNGILIESNLAAEIPATLSVAVRLEQGIVNVVLNAIQQTYLAKGSGVVHVETCFADSRYPIQIRISDTGPGIHTQDLARIFDLGFTTRSDGSGIGLFATRALIESLGGRVTVEETFVQKGSRFLVELPLVFPIV